MAIETEVREEVAAVATMVGIMEATISTVTQALDPIGGKIKFLSRPSLVPTHKMHTTKHKHEVFLLFNLQF